jgi:cytochrome c oxidase accessory protein FixG
MQSPIIDTEEYRDSIATVDKYGKRNWIYPKKVNGKFFKWRTYVSWLLLGFLFGMPFVKYDGQPLFLFNLLQRDFIILGVHFAPQDFYLFVLAMLTFIVFIILFTVVFGRVFCGWVCPQTIFMEMVYRKIEYWIEGDANAQKRLNDAPWTTEKIIKKTSKQAIFFIIAVLVANTFLAWIIGVDEVMKLATEPIAQNWQGFTAMIAFSFAFYFVFSWMREQVCIAICPYGRLQSVLLDSNSIVVHYDHVRGEPRGKIKKQQEKPVLAMDDVETSMFELPVVNAQKTQGDCVACGLCVKVCPTGIDIRNGTQLECINCTACMDACDEVMIKVNRDTGLIRYDSFNGIEQGRKKILTPRVMAYSALLVILLGVQAFFISIRSDVQVLILRTPGILYQEVDDQTLSNLYNYQVINKTNKPMPIEFRLKTDYGQIKLVGDAPTVPKASMAEGALFVELPKNQLDDSKNRIKVAVYSEGKLLTEVKTSFLGPIK